MVFFICYNLIGDNMKQQYIEHINNNFEGEAKELLLNQVELFYKDETTTKNKYQEGEDVYLKKGTHIHGIPGLIDNFDWIINNGFIGNDFTTPTANNKIKNSIGMWDIQEDCYLKDYINLYSGFTITYTIGRGPNSIPKSELIPYHKFDEVTERINNDDNIWMYYGEQTKEVRFIPSLVANKRQIAFILNMESDYAKELVKNDVWNPSFNEETIKPFIDYRYYDKFLVDRQNRNALTTDRETAIMFGLPTSLIEGILVGKEVENNQEILTYIKDKLPDCYICNLDGKVIISNK